MRTTDQKALETDIWNIDGAAEFVWAQLQLTKKLLASLQPTMIVVANAFGCRLTGFHRNQQTGADEWMGLQFTAEPDELGAYFITGSTTAGAADPDNAFGLAGVPVFFTGSFASTNRRNPSKDAELGQRIAKAYLKQGATYLDRSATNDSTGLW